MNNFEKLLEDDASKKMIMELAIECIPAHFCINTSKHEIDPSIDCEECEFREKGKNCDDAMINWLHEEYVEGGEA